jgi:hypothetical protein
MCACDVDGQSLSNPTLHKSKGHWAAEVESFAIHLRMVGVVRVTQNSTVGKLRNFSHRAGLCEYRHTT